MTCSNDATYFGANGYSVYFNDKGLHNHNHSFPFWIFSLIGFAVFGIIFGITRCSRARRQQRDNNSIVSPLESNQIELEESHHVQHTQPTHQFHSVQQVDPQQQQLQHFHQQQQLPVYVYPQQVQFVPSFQPVHQQFYPQFNMPQNNQPQQPQQQPQQNQQNQN